MKHVIRMTMVLAVLVSLFTGCPDPNNSGTPGTPAQVAAPTATPPAGTYTGTQSVTLESATEGAAIYYTTNGDTPTASSTLYATANFHSANHHP